MSVQNSVPAYEAKINLWPSSSLDLNVCNYWLISMIEKISNVNPHPKSKTLEEKKLLLK